MKKKNLAQLLAEMELRLNQELWVQMGKLRTTLRKTGNLPPNPIRVIVPVVGHKDWYEGEFATEEEAKKVVEKIRSKGLVREDEIIPPSMIGRIKTFGLKFQPTPGNFVHKWQR